MPIFRCPRWVKYGMLVLLGGLLLGCDGPGSGKLQFRNTDITGADFGRDFALTDAHGKVRRLADFRGKVVLLFFGYTHCPDVCPTTLGELAGVVKAVGAQGKEVQVVFVTVDPERDTAKILAQYVPFFHPDFIALRPEPQQLAVLSKEFKLVVERQKADAHGNYAVDHTANLLAYDRQGRLRVYIRANAPRADVLADVQQLLRQP